MNGAEILTTIAQLGVAVAGFSGIAIVFNRQPGGLTGFEAFRVSLLFANSFTAVFLALIPFAFFYLGWRQDMIWRAASGICVVFEVGFIATHAPWAWRFLRVRREPFNLKLLTFVACGHLINAIAQLFNAFGMTEGRLSIFIFGALATFSWRLSIWSNSVCSTTSRRRAFSRTRFKIRRLKPGLVFQWT
jgi:hypothetical protein